jgi:hypothetical protein
VTQCIILIQELSSLLFKLDARIQEPNYVPRRLLTKLITSTSEVNFI